MNRKVSAVFVMIIIILVWQYHYIGKSTVSKEKAREMIQNFVNSGDRRNAEAYLRAAHKCWPDEFTNLSSQIGEMNAAKAKDLRKGEISGDFVPNADYSGVFCP